MSLITRLFSSYFTSSPTKNVIKLESLESREVPATFNWSYVGAAPGNFTTAANWQGGVVPPAGSDIFVGVNTGEMSIDQPETIGNLNIDPATVAWTPIIDVNNALNVNNGITAKQANFNLPDTLTINGGTVRTDGSTFKSVPSNGDIGVLNTRPDVTWNIFNTTENMNAITFNNYGTINLYDAGAIYQLNGGTNTNLNNFGGIIADKSTARETYNINIFGTFNNMGLLQVNADTNGNRGTLFINAPFVNSTVGTINVFGGTLSFDNSFLNKLPINFQEDTFNISPNSTIKSAMPLQTTGEVMNFNTDATLNHVFYIFGTWRDNGSIINVNGPSAAEALINSRSTTTYNWIFSGTNFNISLNETTNECSYFFATGAISLCNNVTANVTILQPITPTANTYFSPFMTAAGSIVGNFGNINAGNLISAYTEFNGFSHSTFQFGWGDLLVGVNPPSVDNPVVLVVPDPYDPVIQPIAV